MKRPYTANPGVNLVSISLFNATGIKGVEVDNPSGGWLYIVELKDYVPPYTLAWARTLEYTGTSLNVNYGISPAGQVSTTQGDPYTVTLYDEPITDSAGVPAPGQFISNFTPPTGVFSNAANVNTNSIFSVQIAPAVAGRRYRVTSFGVTRWSQGTTNAIDSPFWVELATDAAGNNPKYRRGIAQNEKGIGEAWAPGLDFEVGLALRLNMQADWADVQVRYTVVALII
jgi:hypothetical protein